MAKSRKTNTQSAAVVAHNQFWRDIKSSVLVVSILINAFFLIGWMVLKMTNQYDGALVAALLGR